MRRVLSKEFLFIVIDIIILLRLKKVGGLSSDDIAAGSWRLRQSTWETAHSWARVLPWLAKQSSQQELN